MNSAINQSYIFVTFMLNGVLIGILFDIFRILRKSFKTPDLITYIQDVLFWILTGVVTLFFVFNFNNGTLRIYLFLGIGLGLILYMIVISKYFIKFNVYIITTIKNIVIKIITILIYPLKVILKTLRRVLIKPISFIFINIRGFLKKNVKKMSNFKIKIKKTNNNAKTLDEKKDFNV